MLILTCKLLLLLPILETLGKKNNEEVKEEDLKDYKFKAPSEEGPFDMKSVWIN